MKKILVALIILGITNFSADAKPKKMNNNPNYKVCLTKSGYQICGKEGTRGRTGMGRMDKENWSDANNETTGPTAMNTNSVSSYAAFYRKHNIIVSDDMNNPYKGEASRQYDGPAKNDERNLNVYQTSIYLPPSSGNNTK